MTDFTYTIKTFPTLDDISDADRFGAYLRDLATDAWQAGFAAAEMYAPIYPSTDGAYERGVADGKASSTPAASASPVVIERLEVTVQMPETPSDVRVLSMPDRVHMLARDKSGKPTGSVESDAPAG